MRMTRKCNPRSADGLTRKGHQAIGFSADESCVFKDERSCSLPDGLACADVLLLGIDVPPAEAIDRLQYHIRERCKVEYFGVIVDSCSVEEAQWFSRLRCKVFVRPVQLPEIKKWVDDVATLVNSRRPCPASSKRGY